MRQIEVQIMGQSYLLACPEGSEPSLLEAVERVDSAMCRIRDAGKVRARDRIAVLAALNLASEFSERSDAQAKAAASAAAKAASAAGDSVDRDRRLGSLLDRLDAALGDDGRLL